MMQYGDEIGMGENLRLPERECARTPMQWTAGRHGGFSTSRRVVRPVIDVARWGYEDLNVADQRRDPTSLLNWTERMIRMRKECPEISWGDWTILKTDQPGVLVMRYHRDDRTLVTLHNFTAQPRAVMLDRAAVDANSGPGQLVDLLATNDSRADANGRYAIQLQPYGYRWLRAGGIDLNIAR
jgi:maltose alpha-D-glucosyltransferase/alpha-amylase